MVSSDRGLHREPWEVYSNPLFLACPLWDEALAIAVYRHLAVFYTLLGIVLYPEISTKNGRKVPYLC